MTNETLSLIRADLPLLVRGIEANDPFLSLVGDDWSLALNCPWELVTPSRTFDCEAEELEDQAWELIGRSIQDVSYPTQEGPAVSFRLTGDHRIDVHPDTDLDPWVMRLPHHVVVGSMTSR